MNPEISVVIPVRNEALNVPALYQELTTTLEGFGRRYEIILIDDGSTDQTFELLADLQARDPRLRIIRFRRNFGQTAGFAAGFAHARGRFIVTSDGDLQNDPRDIPPMVDLAQTYDIVAGWRKDRQDAFINRRLPSMIANWIISRVTGVRLHDYGCSLKVFRAEVVKPLKLYGEMHRFLPAIASEMGVTIKEQVVNHRKRVHGRSNYGISRTIRVVLDLLTVKFLISYSTRPLQIFGLLGLGMGGLGMLLSAWLVVVNTALSPGDCGSSSAAGGDRASGHGRAVPDERADRRDAGAHVPRVAGQADLRDPGNSRGAGAPAGSGGGMRGLRWGGLLAACAGALTVIACGSSPMTPSPPSGGGGGVVTPPANNPPVIASITASVARAEVDTDVALTATVSDAETPVGQLQFVWTVSAGTISGQGPAVTWHTPKDDATPKDYTVTLTVTETYGTAATGGVHQQSVTGQSPVVRLHNSPKELGDLSVGFLSDFANSGIPPAVAVRNFSDSCRGKQDELGDVTENRSHFVILDSSLRLKSARVRSNNTQADMTVACAFTSRIIKCDAGDLKCVVGSVSSVAGDCTLTGVSRAAAVAPLRQPLHSQHDASAGIPEVLRPLTTRALLVLLGLLAGCGSEPPRPAARGSQVTARAPATPPAAPAANARIHLQIKGTRFTTASGVPFSWRGITAFRLLEYVARGDEAAVRAYFAWARDRQLTVVRVLAMGSGFMQLTPEQGRAALPALLAIAREYGLYVEVVALANTRDLPVDLDAHVAAIGQILASHPNALLELANEPIHPTQTVTVGKADVLQALARQVPDDVPVALGSIETDQQFAGGDYVTWHVPRDDASGRLGPCARAGAGRGVHPHVRQAGGQRRADRRRTARRAGTPRQPAGALSRRCAADPAGRHGCDLSLRGWVAGEDP